MNPEKYISKGSSRPVHHCIEYHKCRHSKFEFEAPFEHINVQNLQKFIFLFIVIQIQKVQKKRHEFTGGEKRATSIELTKIDPFSQPPKNVDKWTP